MYPVSFEADYAAEGRNRLTTFFRYIVGIPWLVVAYLYGIGASIVVTLAWFAMVFTGRYPQQLYDFNVGYLRMIARANGFIIPADRRLPALRWRRRSRLPDPDGVP